MGSSQSKEEVIISQAGNSGSVTNGMFNGVSLGQQILIIVLGGLIVAIIMVFCWFQVKKMLEKKIRREITRSQNLQSV